MNTLYELADNYQQALSVLSDLDLPEQAINDTLEGLTGEIEDKCKSVAMYRQSQLVVADAIEDKAKQMMNKAKSIKSQANTMINYLDINMRKSGITEISCDYFTIKYQKNPPSVVIKNDDLIPVEFIKTKITESVDKVALKKALQDGLVTEAAEIQQTERLVIK